MFVQNEEIDRRIERKIGDEEKYKGGKEDDKRQRERSREKESNPNNSSKI